MDPSLLKSDWVVKSQTVVLWSQSFSLLYIEKRGEGVVEIGGRERRYQGTFIYQVLVYSYFGRDVDGLPKWTTPTDHTYKSMPGP
jgi:hypothetical protein